MTKTVYATRQNCLSITRSSGNQRESHRKVHAGQLNLPQIRWLWLQQLMLSIVCVRVMRECPAGNHFSESGFYRTYGIIQLWICIQMGLSHQHLETRIKPKMSDQKSEIIVLPRQWLLTFDYRKGRVRPTSA